MLNSSVQEFMCRLTSRSVTGPVYMFCNVSSFFFFDDFDTVSQMSKILPKKEGNLNVGGRGVPEGST